MNENEKIENLKSELEKTTAPEGITHKEKEDAPKKVGVGVRTYAADIADIMRKEKGSVIKIALAEQERRKAFEEKKDPTSIKNLIVIFLGIIFILGGVMIFVYSIMNKSRPATLSPANVLPGLFYTENQTQIDITNLTRGNLFSAIHTNIDADFAENNTITNIVLTSQTSAGRVPSHFGFLSSKLGLKIPERVLNTFSGNFMLGTYKQSEKGNMFLILKIKDFNESFIAMRDWEITMANDLVRLFRIDPKEYSGSIFVRNFQNAILFNKESRALYDADGILILAYIYIDRNTIMITKHSPSIEEVVKRMSVQSIR